MCYKENLQKKRLGKRLFPQTLILNMSKEIAVMISREIRASPIFGEFTPEEQDRYFNLSKEKVCAHVDTLYYTVSIFNDSNDCPEGVQAMLDQLKGLKIQKALYPSSSFEFFGLSLEHTRFVHYEYCLRLDECFDIFISSILPNPFTPRIVVQLRSRYLVQFGAPQAICKSFRYIEDILSSFGLEVDEVKENRIDFAYHTNIVQNPYKFFNDEMLLSKLKSKLRTYHKVGEIGKTIDIDYISFGHRNSNDLFVRIYNKSREVIEKNYKSFFISKWYTDKLINYYDFYVYSRAYEMKSYVTGLLIGRIEWYLNYGKDDNIKDELLKAKQTYYVKSDNNDHLKKIVDKYLPPVTLIMNIEFQTKRKFYSSLDEYIDCFGLAYFSEGKVDGFYEKDSLPLFRLFTILNLRSEICNYLTSTSLSFVDNKGQKDEKLSYWWSRINQCYIEEFDKRIIDLWRSYERHSDIEKGKRRICGSIASMSILQNNGYKKKKFLEDVSDVLCTLNDNDFYGFAPDPNTGEVPDIDPPFYSDLKVRKERQYRPLFKKT